MIFMSHRKFSIGDRIQVKNKRSTHYGRCGVVERVGKKRLTLTFEDFEAGIYVHWKDAEVVPTVPSREHHLRKFGFRSQRRFAKCQWVQVTYAGSRHYKREGLVQAVGKTLLTVSFQDAYEKGGKYVNCRHVKVVPNPDFDPSRYGLDT